MKNVLLNTKYNEPPPALEKKSNFQPVYGARSGKIINQQPLNSQRSFNNNDVIGFMDNNQRYDIYYKEKHYSDTSEDSSTDSEVAESSIEGTFQDEEEDEENEEKTQKVKISGKNNEQIDYASQPMGSQDINQEDLKKKLSQFDRDRYLEMMKELNNDLSSGMAGEIGVADTLLDGKKVKRIFK